MVVEDADRMVERTSNVLLKSIEEPPPRTVWLLCAPSLEDLIVTVRSRCRHLYVPSPSMEEIVRILTTEEGASEADARLAASASLRHVGRARRAHEDSHETFLGGRGAITSGRRR